ncbi:MAG: TauD/TfdA family dioxygenase [Hyphomonadaceae bacterium]|nr:TauD/TfdA family dioxygenase [Hyphomonadaceae bacterium]
MPEEVILDAPVTGPAVWMRDDLQASDWVWRITPDEAADLDAALRGVEARRLGVGAFGKADFPLPVFGRKLAAIRKALTGGVRFALLRKVELERYDLRQIELLFWGIGAHLGVGLGQNAQGALLTHVTHHNLDPNDPRVRGYQDRREQGPHNDLADVVGLMCVRKARSGGASSIVNSYALYNELLRRRPDLLPLCYRGFYLDYRGEGADPNATTSYRIPIFSYSDGKLSCFYGRRGIDVAMKKRGETPSAEEKDLFALLDELVAQENLRLDMQLETGDIQLINNYSVLHARTAYEDHEDPKLWRLMLRLWLNLPDLELPPRLARFTRAGFADVATAQAEGSRAR